MAVSEADIEEFLSGPLVKWLSTSVKKPETLQIYETFFDGSLFNEVLLQIDPQPTHPVPSLSSLPGLSITDCRIKIFHSIIRNIKSIYEDELGYTIIKLPNCIKLGRAPNSHEALDELRLLMHLLLGCAVQGPTKETFIHRIKEMDMETQLQMITYIQDITDNQTIVMNNGSENVTLDKLYTQVRDLVAMRDFLIQYSMSNLGNEKVSSSNDDGIESNHLAIELADWKAKVRKQRQELEEKTEHVTELKEELEHTNNLISRLKAENADLLSDARRAKSYRDEIDALKEKSERADKLEVEVQRYRERLADAEFFKVRADELKEDLHVLTNTKEMVEKQLARARQKTEHMLELEAELFSCKQRLNDVILERDAAHEKIVELTQECVKLEEVSRSAIQESNLSHISLESEFEEIATSGDNSLSEELSTASHTKALKLELENRKLMSTIDKLKEKNFQESSERILSLEKEKKKLSLKCDQLQENYERLSQQNLEFEKIFKSSLEENAKLQESLDSAKILLDRQNQDLQNERCKIESLEKNIETATKEKQRLQSLCDSIKKRADDNEKSLEQANATLLQLQADLKLGKESEKLANELQMKMATLEKENMGLQKEVTKLKESMELKESQLDEQMVKYEKQTKEISELNKEKENSNQQIQKLLEFEQKAQELLSQTAVYTETISTLQKDLISEKVYNEKFKTSLDKLGLNIDLLDNDINIIVEKMLTNPEFAKSASVILKDKLKEDDVQEDSKCSKCSNGLENLQSDIYSQAEQVVSSISAEWHQQCEKLASEVSLLQQANEALQTENAKMQVDISTLTSQVTSLTAQQTALQLANSQLVAEKEELSKQQKIQSNKHDTLLLDQVTIRGLHEQLNMEYEELKKEEEVLKKLNRDMRSEVRALKETNTTLEKKISSLEQEKDALKNESKSLGNLRAEHSKLKDDFRNLFTANERLKTEYRGLQEEFRTLKSESGKLKMGNTEMQGELNTRSDLVAGLQLENARLQQRCDMLYEMNFSIDTDRRKLMDHVSQLLAQYHSLLTHSLEDKKQFHDEEKILTEKLNNLYRHKEKLEEKIMEHYRKLDNASAKKKGFGANFVRRVRKAGSEIINKVPSRNRRSWHEDARLTQSQFTLAGGSGESGGNDSDNSAEEPVQRTDSFKRSAGSLHGQKPRDEVALRRSHRDITHRSSIAGEQVYGKDTNTSTLSLGSIGTRRTVYLPEDDPPAPPVTSCPTNNQNTPPLLVYNRISTVIGETTRRDSIPQANVTVAEEPPPRDSAANNERKKNENTKENAIWYEYGCV